MLRFVCTTIFLLIKIIGLSVSDPWCGKIPHAVGQLSQGATTTEACVPRDYASKQGSHHNEEPMN